MFKKIKINYKKLISSFFLIILFLFNAPLSAQANLGNTNKGKLFLAVEDRGRIWYVDFNGEKHEVTFSNALNLFEELATGITNENLNKIPLANSSQNTNLGNSHKGKLFLAVEDRGRIWYVDFQGRRHEVTWDNLMDLFRNLSTGINNTNLQKINNAKKKIELDSDGDGLSDIKEKEIGTNILNPDSDGDGYSDGEEVAAGYNPLEAAAGTITTPPSITNGKTFTWNHQGQEYTLQASLDASNYETYNNHSAKILPVGMSHGDYYQKILTAIDQEDSSTIQGVADQLKIIAQRENFSDDELIELAVSFVQTIPYDYDKFDIINNVRELPSFNTDQASKTWPKLPYETLYENKGVCSDKSLLLKDLVDELGYGTALFAFQSKNHIAPAIQCSSEYSSYDSGYCYIESTNTGFKIGDIPNSGFQNGVIQKKSEVDTSSDINIANEDLIDVAVYGQSTGKIYTKIIKTQETLDRIKEMENSLKIMKSELVNWKITHDPEKNIVLALESETQLAHNNYLANPNTSLHGTYTEKYNSYKTAYDSFQIKVNAYNQKINKYNELGTEYNQLIKSFYE